MNRLIFPALVPFFKKDPDLPHSELDTTHAPGFTTWAHSISVRLAIMLSGALLPLGLIAVDQTVRLQSEVVESSNISLQALTAEFAQEEREVIKAAFTAAETLSLTVPELLADNARCRGLMERFVAANHGNYSFTGFLPVDGVMTCASGDLEIDFTDNPEFSDWITNPERDVRVNSYGPIAGGPILIISEPVFAANGNFIGSQIINVPLMQLDRAFDAKLGEQPIDLVTVNVDGEILSTSGARETAREHLPKGMSVKELINLRTPRLEAENAAGQHRLYSIVPVLENGFYVIGSWDPESMRIGSRTGPLNHLILTPALFPLLMWLVSLILIYMALDRQVVRHLRLIAMQMQQFARSRKIPIAPPPGQMPYELDVIEQQFIQVAEKLLHDEAELIDAMHDKDVLLKELHHRVKNNLQLITSIISMQVRNSRNQTTIAALRTVKRRVTSMATVHQTLYQVSDLGQVQANDLLRDVIRPLTDLAPTDAPRPKISMEFDTVTLYPDQAVPLALLTVEAVTNALKYLAPDAKGERWVTMSFRMIDAENVCLTIANSTNHKIETDEESTGLGSQLIRGFARQLESLPEIEKGEDHFSLSLTFEALPFEPTNTVSTEMGSETDT